MELKEKISLEEICEQAFKIRVIEGSEYGKAAFTHYLHNNRNGVSQFYKKEALQHLKRTLEYKFPDEEISSLAAEEALQYMLYDFKNSVPFPEPQIINAKDINFSATLSGKAFRSNIFVLTSQKGFPLQSLTQMAA